MSRYRKIDVGIHNDAKFRKMSDNAKLLWFTILTCPELTSLGCMKFTEAGFAEEMGWTMKDFQKAFKEVLTQGMIKHCREAKFLCIPKFLKYNPPESINVVKSWAKIEPLLPECELRNEHFQEVKGILEGISLAFLEALPHDFEIHDLYPNPIPEPEQDNPPIVPPRGDNGMAINDLVEIWNQLAPVELARVRLPFTRPENKMRRLKTIVKRHPEKEWWKELISLLRHRPFVLGDNDRGWKITFDKLLEDSELIMDGKYLDRRAEAAIKPRSVGCPICGRWIEKCICKSKTEVRND